MNSVIERSDGEEEVMCLMPRQPLTIHRPTSTSNLSLEKDYHSQDMDNHFGSLVSVRLPLKISLQQFEDSTVNFTTVEVGKSFTETKSIGDVVVEGHVVQPVGQKEHFENPFCHSVFTEDNPIVGEEENDEELEDIWADRQDDMPPIPRIPNKLGDLKVSELRNCFSRNVNEEEESIKAANPVEESRISSPVLVKKEVNMWSGHVFCWNREKTRKRGNEEMIEIDTSSDMHSRLFPLLQLTMKNDTSNGVSRMPGKLPTSRGVITKEMVDELVNSLLQTSNGHYLRRVPQDMLQTAARKALEDEFIPTSIDY